jgi:molecular chaperone DnaK
MGTMMHVGIDLGTTNSAMASFDGTTLAVVPNALGEMLTPSVVRVDARSTFLVGRRAFRFLETDPANTRGEFKRLMGTAERLGFEAAGKDFLPEELSAHVLGSLLADGTGRTGSASRPSGGAAGTWRYARRSSPSSTASRSPIRRWLAASASPAPTTRC